MNIKETKNKEITNTVCVPIIQVKGKDTGKINGNYYYQLAFNDFSIC